jgi:hypothetical protein
MRKTTLTFALLLLILLMQSCIPTGNPVPVPTIVGLIENNQSYCGGAAPPQELLDELAIFHASANQTFYIRKGNFNTPFTPVYKTFTTDALGNYSVQLPAGNYAVISEEKYFTELFQIIIHLANSFAHHYRFIAGAIYYGRRMITACAAINNDIY